MKKSILSGAILSACLLIASTASADTFPDVPEGFWADDEIHTLSERETMSGFPDGTFKPSEPVKRIQAGAMIMKELNLEAQDSEHNFNDIPADFPSKDVVSVMERTKIIGGDAEGNFRPYEPVTRAQMSAIISRAYDLESNQDYYFTDIQPDYWSYNGISALAHSGITGGKGDGTYAPSEEMTRAQFVTFLYRADNEDTERDPVEPLAGEYGKFVTYEGKLYGTSRYGGSLNAYEKNNTGEYEEVDSYVLDNENKVFPSRQNMQIVGNKLHVKVENENQEGEQVYSFQDGEFKKIEEEARSNQYHFNNKLYYTDGSTLMVKNGEETNTVTELAEGGKDYTGSKVYYTDGDRVKTYDLLSGEKECTLVKRESLQRCLIINWLYGTLLAFKY
ncbi:S-layer homology domain-containing protein [Salibacterium aidingense]|uniref:S-layer homology domain-containing protein n=1 Tax=Salibacterium aidingense TaxID=384933 RepID=UPI003BBA83F4